ncbi:MAG: metal-sulfur cluster assembly factor [Haloarculaceae archaeon]
MTTTEARIHERLDEIVDPCSAANGTDLSIVDMGLVEAVDVEDGRVTVSMRLTSPFCMQIPYFVEEVEDRIGAVDGVTSVELETDEGIDWHADMMTEAARRQRAERKASRASEYFDQEVAVEDVRADD